jgi:hypothetical protein
MLHPPTPRTHDARTGEYAEHFSIRTADGKRAALESIKRVIERHILIDGANTSARNVAYLKKRECLAVDKRDTEIARADDSFQLSVVIKHDEILATTGEFNQRGRPRGATHHNEWLERHITHTKSTQDRHVTCRPKSKAKCREFGGVQTVSLEESRNNR